MHQFIQMRDTEQSLTWNIARGHDHQQKNDNCPANSCPPGLNYPRGHQKLSAD